MRILNHFNKVFFILISFLLISLDLLAMQPAPNQVPNNAELAENVYELWGVVGNIREREIAAQLRRVAQQLRQPDVQHQPERQQAQQPGVEGQAQEVARPHILSRMRNRVSHIGRYIADSAKSFYVDLKKEVKKEIASSLSKYLLLGTGLCVLIAFNILRTRIGAVK